eukprot:TRINITY_DN16090_c0_g1_i3.p1 TRINITY_DN16090_c0_g1~~TRINITY_DN16090_c0_g1_i3.p1  ORF type:complete len:129 (+),score=26.63 TRINITY_DN16090_c0_g1_i3:191-577(+)
MASPTGPSSKKGVSGSSGGKLTIKHFATAKGKPGRYDQKTANLTLTHQQAQVGEAQLFGTSPTATKKPTTTTSAGMEWDQKNRFSKRKAAATIAMSMKADPTFDSVLQQIGRAVQQECRDRSRMPSSA